MPLTLSSIAIEEKNKLSTDSLWYLAMKVTIPGSTPTIVYVVKNTEDITWAGQTWQAFPFEIDPIAAGNKGEVPRVDVRISNVNRVLEGYVLAYDNYIKTVGFDPIIVDLYQLNSKNLASSTPEVAVTPRSNAARASAVESGVVCAIARCAPRAVSTWSRRSSGSPPTPTGSIASARSWTSRCSSRSGRWRGTPGSAAGSRRPRSRSVASPPP